MPYHLEIRLQKLCFGRIRKCKQGEVQPGRLFVTETGEFAPRYIVNFPPKRHWRGKSLMEDVEAGLEARRFLEKKEATREHLARVGALVEGFESPSGLELFATVHWIGKHEAPGSTEELIRRIHAWSIRKQQFTPRQIEIAARTLASQRWLRPTTRMGR